MYVLSRSKRVVKRVVLAALAVILMLGSTAVIGGSASAATLELSRVEFDGVDLRLRGSGATPGATIFADDIGFPVATADALGDFRVRLSDFVPHQSCILTITDGVNTGMAGLPNCTQTGPPVQPNATPFPNAGPDQVHQDTTGAGVLVTLDGSASSDSDGEIVSWSWTDGTNTVASGVGQPPATGVQMTVSIGQTSFFLSVTDDEGASNSDMITITVQDARVGVNLPPTAVAGPDVVLASVGGFATATLDGSASTDTDGTIVSYTWTNPGGQIMMSGTGAPPIGGQTLNLGIGIHPFTLTVTDNVGATGTDMAVVTVSAPERPVANAGADVIRNDNNGTGFVRVALDGSASTGDALTATWHTSNGALVATDLVTAPIQFDVGVHLLTLTVTNGAGMSAMDFMSITVNPQGSRLPVADAGVDQTVDDDNGDGFGAATLDGSGSSDPDQGGIDAMVDYVWHEGLTTLASGRASYPLNPVIVSLGIGSHTVTLTLVDSVGNIVSADTVVTVLPNIAPTADAGGAIVVEDTDLGGDEAVTLDGSASTDAGAGTIVSYAWTDAGGASLGTGAVVPGVVFGIGQHIVTLTVTDNGGATGTANLLVSVTEPAPDPTGSINIDRAELSNGTRLRLEGSGAVGGSRILINGVDRGGANGAGEFNIRNRNFVAPANCVIVVTDGVNVATATLDGC